MLGSFLLKSYHFNAAHYSCLLDFPYLKAPLTEMEWKKEAKKHTGCLYLKK